jgi:hypothetical protein
LHAPGQELRGERDHREDRSRDGQDQHNAPVAASEQPKNSSGKRRQQDEHRKSGRIHSISGGMECRVK